MRIKIALLILAGLLTQVSCTASAQGTAPSAFLNPKLPAKQRADALISRMTLAEKVSQLRNNAPGIERFGIPAYDWWNEGLHGVARAGFATMFPQAIGNAATWDAPLVHQIATTISIEARAKYNDAIRHGNHSGNYGIDLWSPNINIFRDPRWGRGQETYGEDPFLTSRMGVAFVEGLQGDAPNYYRTIATPKHFAVHSGPEATRHKANVDPSDRDLQDTYLPAFRATITEAKANSIMCAYNAVDGTPACASKLLLADTLRGDWKFQGYVVSDCDAINDFSQPDGHHYAPTKEIGAAAGLRAGTDLDCGGAYSALQNAVQDGLIKEADLTLPLERLFTARIRLGMFDPPKHVPYASIPFAVVNSPEHQQVALLAARESMVLLKNARSFLPLKPGHQTIAVVGPLAASLTALEGNYNAVPRDPILPIDGIVREFGAANVSYAQGAPYVLRGQINVPRTLFHTGSEEKTEGLTGEYFTRPDFSGTPAMTRIDKEIDFDWRDANPIPALSADTTAQSFAVRWTGVLSSTTDETDTFQLHLSGCYPCDGKLKYEIYLDGKLLDSSAKNQKFSAPQFSVSFIHGQPHQLRIDYVQSGNIRDGGNVKLTWPPQAQTLLKQAIETANKADVVLAFVGLTSQLEGESHDRSDIDLPEVQQTMLEALAKTGKPVVVILLNGGPLAVNWAQKNAAAILETWYPGQAGGQAIAETLSGKNNPAGRLPITFYKGLDQLPAFEDYSMVNRTYRYFSGEPLFRFGDGLSYTTFAYSHLKLRSHDIDAGDPLIVEADVTNSGSVSGDEVAELYFEPPHTPVSPKLALAGFQRISLAPGESKHLTFELDARTISEVDAKGMRSVEPGEYKLYIGGSQPHGDHEATIATAAFTIHGTKQLPN
jgi:beta-glucosidase